jgi:hypothetical protein
MRQSFLENAKFLNGGELTLHQHHAGKSLSTHSPVTGFTLESLESFRTKVWPVLLLWLNRAMYGGARAWNAPPLSIGEAVSQPTMRF